MPKAKPFTKDQILNAMDKTLSVRAAARYLNCSYQHLKKWMKEYKDEKTGLTLFELNKNSLSRIILKSYLTCFAGAAHDAGLKTSPVSLLTKA